MSKKVFECDVFIFPNGFGKLNEYCLGVSIERRLTQIRNFGFEVTEDSLVFEGRITTKRNNTGKPIEDTVIYGDPSGEDEYLHGCYCPEDIISDEWLKNHPESLSRFGDPILPELIPIELFKGKKEGDVVETALIDSDIVISMRLYQQGYRYARCGNFEDIFQKYLEHTTSLKLGA